MQDVCTDAEMIALIARAQRGESAAYDRLYNLYADKIFRYLYARLPQRECAEDLTAEVFVRMLRMLPRYRVDRARPVAAFSGWLYRIANNLVTDYYRRQRFRQHTDITDHAEMPCDGPSLHQHAETSEERGQLWQAIGRLAPEQQAVVIYRFAEQFSLQEVADLMGKSAGAVKALQHRALANLRRMLTREVG
jgi:RNA polymerase sigma-70 factor (ECF subfamily)